MALPAASCAADIPADYCCDTLANIANRIRTVAMDGLVSCMDPSCADREFRSFVTIGPNVQDPLGDSLIVHMTDFGPTVGSTDGPGNLFKVAVFRGVFEVRLLDNGWPMIQAEDMTASIIAPDSDYVHAVAMHSMAHGEKMYRALVDAIQRNEIFVGSANGHIGKVQISALRPIQPTAFMVGWNCTVSVESVLR